MREHEEKKGGGGDRVTDEPPASSQISIDRRFQGTLGPGGGFPSELQMEGRTGRGEGTCQYLSNPYLLPEQQRILSYFRTLDVFICDTTVTDRN